MVQFSNGKLYERYGEGLTDVPDDIPENTTGVQLSFNYIQIVKWRSFSHLSLCLELDLRENLIHEIEPEAFDGLKRLKTLDLSYNRLKVKQENGSVLFDSITKQYCCNVFSSNFPNLTASESIHQIRL